jgi:hypothetical protein
MDPKLPPLPRPPMVDWGRADEWLQEASKRTGCLAFGVAIMALFVSLIGLRFIFAGYCLQKKSDRPILAFTGSTGSRIREGAIDISWTNVGKQPGRRGVATLFIDHEDRQGPEKVGSAPIEAGAGRANILPGASAATSFKVEEQRIRGSSLLVCTTYFDDAGVTYRQAFFLRPSLMPPNEPVGSLEEQSSPKNEACAGLPE